MTRAIKVSKAELVAALVRREAVAIVEGRNPMLGKCNWCGKLVASKRNRKPPRFCRVPAQCSSKAQLEADYLAVRAPFLVGPIDFDRWLEWSQEHRQ